MRATVRTGGRPGFRRWEILLVAGLFSVTLITALLYPRSLVRGDASVGPQAFTRKASVTASYTAAASWSGPQRAIVLTVRPKEPCRLRLAAVTSTAPQRLEVTLAQTGSTCVGPRHSERFVLPHPAIWGPGQNVRINLSDRTLQLRWRSYRRA